MVKNVCDKAAIITAAKQIKSGPKNKTIFSTKNVQRVKITSRKLCIFCAAH